MATEIERKFLVTGDAWRQLVEREAFMRQGYFNQPRENGERASVRIRLAGDEAFLNIKSAEEGTTRTEFEYGIPVPDAVAMLDELCLQPLIEKVRYWVPWEGLYFEIDVFQGRNAGLTVAELELPTADHVVSLPEWIGREVSDDYRYYNTALARRPYDEWTTDAEA
ncbi:MAG: CYTH domain-containing protein [Gammaproteobacteria bacterium]|nr:CYTH domain-containing protein [Gammaproteobacteria bacterium]